MTARWRRIALHTTRAVNIALLGVIAFAIPVLHIDGPITEPDLAAALLTAVLAASALLLGLSVGRDNSERRTQPATRIDTCGKCRLDPAWTRTVNDTCTTHPKPVLRPGDTVYVADQQTLTEYQEPTS